MNDNFKIVRITGDIGCLPRGCHCDLNDGERPDECVFDLGRVNDCSTAMQLAADGKGRNDCEHWRPETPQPKPVVITDEEREAIARLCEAVAEYSDIDRKANGCHADDDMAAVDVARGLLERLG